MLEEGMPDRLPGVLDYDRGGLFAGIRPNWVKLWEVDAAEAEAREAARRVRAMGDEGQIALFLLLGEKRYTETSYGGGWACSTTMLSRSAGLRRSVRN